MSRVRAVAAFVYDFVVGDDWRLAVGALVALGGAALLVAAGLDAWWFVLVVVALVLWASVRRAP